MRLNKIQISWFRGASDSATLDLGAKNAVIYGSNGSGKSTFVDAIEYIINNGKIRHLSHEYSGKKQELGVRNTHTPNGLSSRCAIHFEDGPVVTADIKPSGKSKLKSDPQGLLEFIQKWPLENHLLRQDEVSDFIQLPKGQKYSVLLPLLGLDDLEFAADNFRQLKKYISNLSKVEIVKIKLRELNAKISKQFGSTKPSDILQGLCDLAGKYLEEVTDKKIPSLSYTLYKKMKERIETATVEHDRYLIFKQILDEEVDKKLESYLSIKEKSDDLVAPLVDSKISVLESTLEFINNLENLNEEIPCPSCGRTLKATDLAEHVKKELNKLKEARELRNSSEENCKIAVRAINEIIRKFDNPSISNWLKNRDQKILVKTINYLRKMEINDSKKWDAKSVSNLQQNIPKIVGIVTNEIKKTPPSVKDFIHDFEKVKVALIFPGISGLQSYVTKVDSLLNALVDVESSIRAQIRAQTEDIIKEISSKVQELWSKLHPNEPIEGARLYIPSEIDKAIDIAIKFFGVEQPSPRLTLSESHRNCLGLCIFLAFSLLRADPDNPIILDDIVSSLDREHRGRLADILMEDLNERQIVLFTHDREWYSELRFRLPNKKWKFLVLRHWINPKIGLRWSKSSYTFDEARELAKDHPESSGNRTRAAMDGQMAIVAERLRLPMPFLRGDSNDRRTFYEFFNSVIGESKKNNRFRKKDGEKYVPFKEPISKWEKARDLLCAWGNPPSHTGSLTEGEAEELIEVCENALESFRCTSCNEFVWLADIKTKERLQCSCGEIQWRYG